MDLSSYLFFASVVEAGSFSIAAQRLGMDRSNVSRRIKELEGNAAAQLLRRTTRKMILTELGEVFYAQCVNIRGEVEQANSILHSLTSAVRGPIHVNCPPALGRLFLIPMFEKFCRRYPAVSLRLTLKGGAIDLVEERVDVALRFTDDPEPNYIARPLGKTQWLLCASPAYLVERGIPTVPEDLVGHSWLGVRSRMELNLSDDFEGHRIVLTSRAACADYALLGQMAIDALGIAILPGYVASNALGHGTLQTLLSGYRIEPTPGSTLYAITIPSLYVPPQVKAFVNFVKEEFGAGLPWERRA